MKTQMKINDWTQELMAGQICIEAPLESIEEAERVGKEVPTVEEHKMLDDGVQKLYSMLLRWDNVLTKLKPREKVQPSPIFEQLKDLAEMQMNIARTEDED